MTRRQYAVLAVGLLATAVGVGGAEAVSSNWRIGHDTSLITCLPYRYYAIELGEPTVEPGSLVAFKAFGLEPHFTDGAVFTKKVLGVPGDRVEVSAHGVTVNGEHLEFTAAALDKLEGTVALIKDSYVLAPDQYFMAGTEPGSFDSRYYGPISSATFIGASFPIW